MLDPRPFSATGRFENEWLNAHYHFSFAGYRDPQRMHWGALRVWNDDEVKPGTGFSPHSHADMEIVTYVRAGAITHEDSLGNRGRTAAGDVQVMSAGSGITHAEYNLEDEPTTLFQIWIVPKEKGGPPFWGAAQFPKGARANGFVTLASGFAADQAEGALPIRQDARVLGANLAAGAVLELPLNPQRYYYLVAASGALDANGAMLGPRDALALHDEHKLKIVARADCDLVLVDAPA